MENGIKAWEDIYNILECSFMILWGTHSGEGSNVSSKDKLKVM